MTAKDRSEIPERRELVNQNDMKDVFRTALVGSIGDKHKYGSYPDKLNDKTPLTLRNNTIFCHAGSVKTFDQCKPNCIFFSKQNQL